MPDVRKFSKPNYDIFCNTLKDIDWYSFIDRCEQSNDADFMYNEFIDMFSKAFNLSFPKKKMNNSNPKHNKISNPWMTEALIKSCRKKFKLLKKFKIFLLLLTRSSIEHI